MDDYYYESEENEESFIDQEEAENEELEASIELFEDEETKHVQRIKFELEEGNTGFGFLENISTYEFMKILRGYVANTPYNDDYVNPKDLECVEYVTKLVSDYVPSDIDYRKVYNQLKYACHN